MDSEKSRKEEARQDDPIDALKGFASTTSRVVQQAASILEEEMAAGILAAKQIEKRFINVEDARSESQDDLFNRFRKDSHEVLDIFMDMAITGAKYAATLPKKAISIRPLRKKAAADGADSALPVMELPDAVKPGGSVEMDFVLANSSETETESFKIIATDLISPDGERLTDRNVVFTPEIIEIPPGETTTVKLAVSAPKSQKLGLYSGMIQATGKDLRAILAVRVEG